MEKHIARAAERLARLDVSGTTADLHRLKDEEGRLDVTISDARREQRGVAREIENRREAGPDADKAADALLGGVDVLDAVESIETLEARRATMLAGLSGLDERKRAAQGEARQIREDHRKRAVEAIDPLADGLEQETRAAAQRLLALFADVATVDQAFAHPRAARLRMVLGDALARLRPVLGEETLSGVAPSPELANFLDLHRETISIGGRAVPERIALPLI